MGMLFRSLSLSFSQDGVLDQTDNLGILAKVF